MMFLMAKKEWSNEETAQMLENVVAAKIIKKEDRFTIIAYQKAASSVKHADSEIKDIWNRGKLTDLPGIGKNIASHLDELFRTGKVKHFEEIFKGLPQAMFELIKISGIGPNIAYKLCLKLKIKNPSGAIKKLKKAIKQGKVREIDGFGEKSEKEISQALKELSGREKRILFVFANQAAEEILSYLKQCPEVIRTDVLGSLRRKCSTVRDIDISVKAKNAKKVIAHFINYPKITKIIESGEKKARILISKKHQVDLMVEPPESYGSLLQHFTGSKEHNIHLREIAKNKGWSVSEHGITRQKLKHSGGSASGRKVKKFKDEKTFYNFLGMEWIPPELREDKGEIEKAQSHKLPKLLKLKNIKGDLHIHSSFDIETSHDLGSNSMKTMVQKAIELGYEYIGFAEHNPSISKHTDKEIIAVIKRKKEEIDKLNYSSIKNTRNKLFVFNSLEIDIRPNGQRAIADKALNYLDFGIAAIHSSFRMERSKMTQRILKGLDHPKIKILAHPTGRILDKRKGYELDWDKIFDFCKKNNKFLEINSYPRRLDLPGPLIRQAIKTGVKLIINTDSHAVSQMDFMEYGVNIARRGWATKNDIINSLGYNKIKKLLV